MRGKMGDNKLRLMMTQGEELMFKRYMLVLAVSILIILSSCGFPIQKGLSSEAEAKSLSAVFKRVNPAVVVIITQEHAYSDVLPGVKVTKKGLGSGVVISKDGLVMTAAHVVHVADEVAVHFLNGESVKAKVVGASSQADVAMVKLEHIPDNMVVAELGDSNMLDIGEEVFVVGAPYGIDHTLTVGYMSGRRKPQGVCDNLVPIEFLQTDASINKGNSGGPMFSMEGKVIGIVSHILSRSGGSDGVGFAASINTARDMLLDKQSFWAGLEGYLLSGSLAEAFNLPQESGLLVQRVAQDSPAQELGLRPGMIPVQISGDKLLIGGDIILEVQGTPISSSVEETCQIRNTMWESAKLESIDMKVLRGGEIVKLSVSQ
jgi:S1-C subfamily serine protease